MHRPVVSIVAGLVEYEQKLGDLFFLSATSVNPKWRPSYAWSNVLRPVSNSVRASASSHCVRFFFKRNL